MRALLTALVMASTLLAPGAAQSQERFPAKPLEMIVPWGPGGGADILGRLVAKWMEADLKATVPVINMPGATGAIGVEALSRQSVALMQGRSLDRAGFRLQPHTQRGAENRGGSRQCRRGRRSPRSGSTSLPRRC